ncbi:MAG: CHAT domain-containing protein, partial [Delftia sp.]|nr:CHAT domain-containing protein [Delftia sp.]
DSSQHWLAKADGGSDGLALHLDLPGHLADLPWELLRDKNTYRCGHLEHPFTPVRRGSNDGAGGGEAANRPLRVLFMACSPLDVKPVLEFENEERIILDATKDQTLELVVEESGSLEGLKRRLEWAGSGYFDVIHITGHGDVVDGVPCMLMEDDLGQRQDATAQDIADTMAGTWPRMMFLSGCKTGMSGSDGAMTSLAEALVVSGAPAVLGWALPVGDQWASLMAAQLYHRLAIGVRVD